MDKMIFKNGEVFVDITTSLKQCGKYAFLLRVHDHIWHDKEFSWQVQFISCYRVRLLALEFINENAYVKPRWPFYYGRYE